MAWNKLAAIVCFSGSLLLLCTSQIPDSCSKGAEEVCFDHDAIGLIPSLSDEDSLSPDTVTSESDTTNDTPNRESIYSLLESLKVAVRDQQKLLEGLHRQLDDQIALLENLSSNQNGGGRSHHSSQFPPPRIRTQWRDSEAMKPANELMDNWSSHFRVLFRVQVGVQLSCVQVASTSTSNPILRNLLVAGGTDGTVHVAHIPVRSPTVTPPRLVSSPTPSSTAVTALLALTIRRNETWLFSGHQDGSLFLSVVGEVPAVGEGDRDDLGEALSVSYLRTIHQPAVNQQESDASLAENRPIRVLESFRSGNVRYIMATDSEGSVTIFRMNGTWYGSRKLPGFPLAFLRTPYSQRLFFLTNLTAGTLDLKTLELTVIPCVGLGNSTLVTTVFDASGRSKAYALTDEGEVLQVALTGGGTSFECHIRGRKRFDFGPELASMVKLNGYLIVLHGSMASIFNISSKYPQGFSPTKLVATLPLRDLSPLFLPLPATPLAASNRDGVIAISSPDGTLHVLHSRLPTAGAIKGPIRNWTFPALAIAVFLMAACHFSRGRKLLSTYDDDDSVVPITSELNRARFRNLVESSAVVGDGSRNLRDGKREEGVMFVGNRAIREGLLDQGIMSRQMEGSDARAGLLQGRKLSPTAGHPSTYPLRRRDVEF